MHCSVFPRIAFPKPLKTEAASLALLHCIDAALYTWDAPINTSQALDKHTVLQSLGDESFTKSSVTLKTTAADILCDAQSQDPVSLHYNSESTRSSLSILKEKTPKNKKHKPSELLICLSIVNAEIVLRFNVDITLLWPINKQWLHC